MQSRHALQDYRLCTVTHLMVTAIHLPIELHGEKDWNSCQQLTPAAMQGVAVGDPAPTFMVNPSKPTLVILEC